MIPITRPHLGEEEAEAAREVILSGWVAQGPKVREFEGAFASYVGSRHACAVSSCTAALHLALLAVGVEPGDVVITVSHSFIATANSVRHCFAEPVFVDIESETFNMSPALLEKFLAEECEAAGGRLYYKDPTGIAKGESPLAHLVAGGRRVGKVAAVMPVHQMGMPCDMAALLEISRRYGLPVVEDAACAIGSEVLVGGRWEKVGRPHGDLACFSFHPRKIITTGEGGMITTDNPDIDKRLRLLREHGMSLSASERHGAVKAAFESYLTTGYNYRMTDMQAAVGLVQLGRLPGLVSRRRELAALYAKGLVGISWLRAPAEPPYARANWQSYPIRLLPGAPVGRDALMQRLLDAGVSTRPGIMNAHAEVPYGGGRRPELAGSESARNSVILLPVYPGMGDEDVERVVGLIKNAK